MCCYFSSSVGCGDAASLVGDFAVTSLAMAGDCTAAASLVADCAAALVGAATETVLLL